MKTFVAIAFLFALFVETGCGVFPLQGERRKHDNAPAYNPPSKSHPFPIDRHRNSQMRKNRNLKDCD